MKKLLLLLSLLAVPALAADLTYKTSTPNYQNFNEGVRDVKDGTNALTRDVVLANDYKLTASSQTLVKSSGGYLDNFTFHNACTGNYIVADSAAAGSSSQSYANVIGTFTFTSAVTPGFNIAPHVRFSNGLAFTLPASSCTVSVSYR